MADLSREIQRLVRAVEGVREDMRLLREGLVATRTALRAIDRRLDRVEQYGVVVRQLVVRPDAAVGTQEASDGDAGEFSVRPRPAAHYGLAPLSGRRR